MWSRLAETRAQVAGAGGIDAVAVFTPAPLHAEMVVQALASGRHVLSAVPAATSLPDCDRLLAAVRKNELYIIPYPEVRSRLQAHFDSVLAALPPEGSDAEGVAKRAAAMAKWVQERQAQFERR